MSALTPYRDLHHAAKELFQVQRPLAGMSIGNNVRCRTYQFVSGNSDTHPPANYESSGPTYEALVAYFLERNPHSARAFTRELHLPDREIAENRSFSYLTFLPKADDDTPAKRITLLLHGLNEKSWHKYVPWAVRLVELTGRPVVLFPLAFHLNRAPAAWSSPREMMGVAKERQNLFADLQAGSFANAALSHRVQFAPHRFLTSSFQSYYDVIDLVRSLHLGDIHGFATGCRVDLFGYSIGASLAQLLLMSDPERLFAESSAFLFCGGALLEDANPVSRTIIDGAAYTGLQGYLRRLTSPLPALPDGIERPKRRSRELRLFRSLLFRDALRGVRERAMRRVSVRIRALAMARDPVFPAAKVKRSWRSRLGKLLLRVYTHDADLDYTHEKPFPLVDGRHQAVEESFSAVFQAAAHHLAGAALRVRAAGVGA